MIKPLYVATDGLLSNKNTLSLATGGMLRIEIIPVPANVYGSGGGLGRYLPEYTVKNRDTRNIIKVTVMVNGEKYTKIKETNKPHIFIDDITVTVNNDNPIPKIDISF